MFLWMTITCSWNEVLVIRSSCFYGCVSAEELCLYTSVDGDGRSFVNHKVLSTLLGLYVKKLQGIYRPK